MSRQKARPLRTAIAGGVARLREEHLWSQAELASIMRFSRGFGWNRSAVSNIESGQRRPTTEELLALLQVFRVGIADLIGPDPVTMPWGEGLAPGGQAVAEILTGEELRPETDGRPVPVSTADLEARAHAAARLGMTEAALERACRLRYGHGFLEQRTFLVDAAVAGRSGDVDRRSVQALRAAAAKRIVSEIEQRLRERKGKR